MATTAVSVIERRVAEQIGDYIEVIVTTAINADNLIVSTNLNQFDHGRNDWFNNWWVYITDKANITINRQVSDYATSTGTLTIRGAALSDDSANLATIRLHRYNRDWYVNAMNDTVREIPFALFQEFDVTELVTGNILPNSHFRDWTSSANPDKWSADPVGVTVAEETGAGNFRGGAKSIKITTASIANSGIFITSDDYPRLLDLMGTTVNLRVWAKPDIADDAVAIIFTTQADGTTQTLTSTTSTPAGEFTLIELLNQRLNDDLVTIKIKFGVVSTGNNSVYFDHARLQGRQVSEYLLPIDFRDGSIQQVFIQTVSFGSNAEDDLQPITFDRVYGYQIVDDGTDQWLRIPDLYLNRRLIRIKGTKPLSTVSAFTDTIEIGENNLNLFIAYTKYKLWQAIEGPVSSDDVSRYERNSAKAYAEFKRLLPSLRKSRLSGTLNVPSYGTAESNHGIRFHHGH